MSDISDHLTRRQMLRRAAFTAAALAVPFPLGCGRPGTEEDDARAAGTDAPPDAAADAPLLAAEPSDEDVERLAEWTAEVRLAGLHRTDARFGLAAARVGELAAGTPYEGFTLEQYIRAGGNPARTEPLTLSLTVFDCVSLVESCIAIARLAGQDAGGRADGPAWADYGREMERLRYRGGVREGYASRLHYFSEWISDNASRGGMRDIGQELGGVADERPLRFMTGNRDAYPALESDEVYAAIGDMERRLDGQTRWVVPTNRIPAIADRLETGDIVAFATTIDGLDVTHAAFAYRTPDGVMRVLHAPLSGGVVEITDDTLHEYVTAIRRSTGILVARPNRV